MKLNMKTRNEALDFLKTGGTVLVFPSGGGATAEKGFGEAEELPWKTFTARLVKSAGAAVIPVFFHGQNGRVFHLASRVSATLRTSLFIHEFSKLSGRTLRATIGDTLGPEELAELEDRKELIGFLQSAVMSTRPAQGVLRRPKRHRRRFRGRRG